MLVLEDKHHLAIYNVLERVREVYEKRNPDEALNQEQKELCRKVWIDTEVCRGRQLALLDKYCVGLGPVQARKGDSICILHGSRIPWVLRARPPEANTYEVIGQCFVHGLMYGEAVDWAEEDADTFVLV